MQHDWAAEYQRESIINIVSKIKDYNFFDRKPTMKKTNGWVMSYTLFLRLNQRRRGRRKFLINFRSRSPTCTKWQWWPSSKTTDLLRKRPDPRLGPCYADKYWHSSWIITRKSLQFLTRRKPIYPLSLSTKSSGRQSLKSWSHQRSKCTSPLLAWKPARLITLSSAPRKYLHLIALNTNAPEAKTVQAHT